MATRFRFRIAKLFISIAIYAAALAWNRELGWLGFALGMACGTSWMLVLLVAKRDDLDDIGTLLVCILVGTICFGLMLPSPIDLIIPIVASAMIGMWINRIHRKRKLREAETKNGNDAAV